MLMYPHTDAILISDDSSSQAICERHNRSEYLVRSFVGNPSHMLTRQTLEAMTRRYIVHVVVDLGMLTDLHE